MGFVKKWDMQDIHNQINKCYIEAVSSYNDGFTAWMCKKELLELKFRLDEMLESTPHFSDLEEQFLKEQEQKKIIKILKT